MRKVMQLVTVLLVACIFKLSADYSDEPHMFLSTLTKDIIEIVKNNQDLVKKDPEAGARIVEPLIKPHVSFELMAKYIVGKKTWSISSKAEQKAFIDELRELLIRTYSTTILALIDGDIKYYPPKGSIQDKDKVQVPSVVLLDSKKIRLMYRLVRDGNDWKIYDILVEKVSLVKGFRSQFAEIIESGKGLDGIIAQLKKTKAAKKIIDINDK